MTFHNLPLPMPPPLESREQHVFEHSYARNSISILPSCTHSEVMHTHVNFFTPSHNVLKKQQQKLCTRMWGNYELVYCSDKPLI